MIDEGGEGSKAMNRAEMESESHLSFSSIGGFESHSASHEAKKEEGE